MKLLFDTTLLVSFPFPVTELLLCTHFDNGFTGSLTWVWLLPQA